MSDEADANEAAVDFVLVAYREEGVWQLEELDEELLRYLVVLHEGEPTKLARVEVKDPPTGPQAPTREELAEFKRSGFSVKQFKKDHLFKSIRTEDPLELMKHALIRCVRRRYGSTT